MSQTKTNVNAVDFDCFKRKREFYLLQSVSIQMQLHFRRLFCPSHFPSYHNSDSILIFRIVNERTSTVDYSLFELRVGFITFFFAYCIHA